MTAQVTFQYGLARVGELRIHARVHERGGKQAVTGLEIEGESLQPTPRFWSSLFHRFGVSEGMFKYFDHAEVFERIAQRSKSDCVRYCIERPASGPGRLLAVSNPLRPVVAQAEVSDLVARHGGRNVSYDNGVITSFHVPRSGEGQFAIGADEFKHRFVMDVPIDGFGTPKIHLSLLRLLCTNGAIGYSAAFRSEIPTGKDAIYSLARALETFDNGDGFAALRQRFQSAQTSWASLFECHQLYKTLSRLVDTHCLTAPRAMSEYYRVTGNANAIYGLANLDALTVKRQRVLPAKCRVYDLLNFASELATHHATPLGNRALQAYIGTLISDEYDMEGTANKLVDFDDFFIPAEDASPRSSVN